MKKAYTIIVLALNLLCCSSGNARPNALFISQAPQAVHQIVRIATHPAAVSARFQSTTVTTDTEALVIYRVVEQRCPTQSVFGPPVISITPPSYGFYCPISAGHSITATIERFLDADAAQAAFTAERGEHPLEVFHNYPAYSWQATSSSPITKRGHSFQPGRWVVRTSAQDDTPLGPGLPSEDLYQAAARYCLFPGQRCTVFLAHIQSGFD